MPRKSIKKHSLGKKETKCSTVREGRQRLNQALGEPNYLDQICENSRRHKIRSIRPKFLKPGLLNNRDPIRRNNSRLSFYSQFSQHEAELDRDSSMRGLTRTKKLALDNFSSSLSVADLGGDEPEEEALSKATFQQETQRINVSLTTFKDTVQGSNLNEERHQFEERPTSESIKNMPVDRMKKDREECLKRIFNIKGRITHVCKREDSGIENLNLNFQSTLDHNKSRDVSPDLVRRSYNKDQSSLSVRSILKSGRGQRSFRGCKSPSKASSGAVSTKSVRFSKKRMIFVYSKNSRKRKGTPGAFVKFAVPYKKPKAKGTESLLQNSNLSSYRKRSSQSRNERVLLRKRTKKISK